MGSSLTGLSSRNGVKGLPIIVALVWLTGCAHSVPGPVEPSRPTTVSPPGFRPAVPPPVSAEVNADKRVVFSPSLQNALKVTDIRSTAGMQGYLKIQVNIQNTTGAPKKFSYRIEWFDSDGQPLPLASAADQWMLLAHETSVIAATAPTPAAKDFGIAFFDR